jgi:hypothetical protein
LNCSNSAEKLSTLCNLVAILISEGRSVDDLNIIGSFITNVGGLISLIATQKQNCESKRDKLNQIQDLKKQIKDLEDSLH